MKRVGDLSAANGILLHRVHELDATDKRNGDEVAALTAVLVDLQRDSAGAQASLAYASAELTDQKAAHAVVTAAHADAAAALAAAEEARAAIAARLEEVEEKRDDDVTGLQVRL